jgi:signal transduction histidine kinase
LPRLEHDEVVQVEMETVREQLSGAVALQQGITHTLHVALRRGAEIFGVLTAGYRKRQEPLPARQARIAGGIAQLASLALENARLVEETERAHQVKSEFVATVSHELRTPLNVIMGYNDLLLGEQFGPVSAAQRETLERVARNARLLVDLINDTLDLSRIESGRMSIEPDDVLVPDVFAALNNETHELQQKPGVQFRWTAAPDVPTLHTDPVKLKVVLKNLIVNAAKFTEMGSVTVAACARDGGVEVSVADTGIGISQEELPLIFEAFRHVNGSTTTHHRGAGLGLYLVSRLLELLGGTIAVDSAVGRGSTFRVWLPCEDPA